MAKFADGLKSLFTGPDTSKQDAEIARQRDTQRLALDKQREAAGAGDEALDAGKRSRIPRGRRLLLAATGEAGLPDLLGG